MTGLPLMKRLGASSWICIASVLFVTALSAAPEGPKAAPEGKEPAKAAPAEDAKKDGSDPSTGKSPEKAGGNQTKTGKTEGPQQLPSSTGGSDSDTAMLLAMIPGMGQLYLGNVEAGLTQAVLFGSFLGLAKHYTRQPDYIKAEDRSVEFDPFQIYLAQELHRRNFLHQELPVFNETAFHRTMRMTKDGRTVEINPLLEYGPYDRTSVATVNAEMAGQTAQHVLFYSIYSTYRDLGHAPNHEDGYVDLGLAPFRYQYLSDPMVFLPLAVLAISAATDRSVGRRTLVPPGMKSGQGDLYTGVISFNAGVSEEAFFRGVLNTSFTRSMGPVGGGALSGLIFGLAHYDGSPASITFPTLAGFYFAYLHYLNGFDIRPGIALHVWWDVIVIALEVKQWKEDRRASIKPNEVHYMPTLFQYRF